MESLVAMVEVELEYSLEPIATDLTCLENEIERVHRLLKPGESKRVELSARFRALQLQKFLVLFDMAERDLEEIFKTLDMIIIVCGPDAVTLAVIIQLEQSMCRTLWNDSIDLSESIDVPALDPNNLPKILVEPSFEEFISNSSEPFILMSILDSWPALVKWNDPNYILQVAGHRHVPVEMGASYLDSNWSQAILSLKSFFNDYLRKQDISIAYLAQYDLLSAVPQLAEDVSELEYLYIDLGSTSCHDPIRNIWIGSSYCYSPIHFDRKDNIYCQIVGRKLIKMYEPDRFDPLDPAIATIFNQNTLNISNGSHLEIHPRFEVVLEPGMALFIPKGWWHEVKSLSYSISLSHWF